MQHAKKDGELLKVERSKINLKMDFDARDVIDILVSEQEQNIENHITNLKIDVKRVKKELEQSNEEIQTYVRKYVKEKYGDKFDIVQNTFKEIGVNASVRFEIIDGSDMPFNSKRPVLISNPGQEYKDKDDRVIVALIICNKDFDRNTVDNTVSFYLESDYDEELKRLNKENEELTTRLNSIKGEINQLTQQLQGTDRLVRRARAAVTKKAVGQDVDELLADFRQQYPQIELKGNESQEAQISQDNNE